MKTNFSKEFSALGTEVYLKINNISQEKAEELFTLAKKIYIQEEKIFSRFDDESELSFFNHNLGKFFLASEDFLAVCQKALFFYQKGQGYFDPRVIKFLENFGYQKDFKNPDKLVLDEQSSQIFEKPLDKELLIKKGKICFLSRMDLSGLAKSFIVEKIAKFFQSQGYSDFIIDTGGDMIAQGDNEGKNWTVDLEGFNSDKLILDISQKAVATSGITRRKWSLGEKKFHHLINPLDPQNFSFNLKSVTVVADNLMKADFWAKTLFIQGLEKGLASAKKEKIKAFFLDYQGHLYSV